MRALLLLLALLGGCGREERKPLTSAQLGSPSLEEAERIVRDLYDPYLAGQGGPPLEQTGKLSSSFQALLEEEAKRAVGRDGPGPLDYDVVVDAQDWQITDLKLKATREGTHAKVIAEFQNFGAPVRLEWDLIQDGTTWRVDNVRSEARDARLLLRASLGASPAPGAAPVLDGPSPDDPPSTHDALPETP